MSKDWERAWSFDEIVENASNWSLAGDAGLLKNLEAFAENLFERTNKTNDNLNKLLDNLDSASIRLDLIKNEFLSLQNTQFVESRVYEDDETLQAPPEPKEQKKTDNDEKMKNLRNAVIEGLDILDKYYDKVQVDASDSEDEVDFVSYVLRPKDPYLDRPLPYVIGSEEWHKKWHAGLQDSSSESEQEAEVDKFSDSDSEENLPVPDRRRDLASASDDSDLSKPVASSTFNDTDSEDANSMPAKEPSPRESFAEQLAARLGNVVVQSSREEPEREEINNRPIKPAVPKDNQRVFGDLFSNEPPPLESEDERTDQGVFSGGKGLFDESDDENESFWGQKIPSKKQPTTEDRPSNILSSTLFKPESKGFPSGLFDDSDEDNIFAEAKTTKSPYLGAFDSRPSFIDDEPPELIVKKKVNANVVPKDLVAEIKQKVEKEEKKEVVSAEEESKKDVEEPKKRIVGGLFDEPVDLFDDDLFGDVQNSTLFGEDIFSKKKKSGGLFDEEERNPKPLVISAHEKTSTNLFDDNDDDHLFVDKKPQDAKIPSLFDDSPPPDPDWDDTSQKNLFDDEDDDNDFLHTTAATNSTQKFSLFDDEPPALDFHKHKNTNLFEDDDDNDEIPPKDIFKNDESVKSDDVVKSDVNIRDQLLSAVNIDVNGAGETSVKNIDSENQNNEAAKVVKMFDEEEEDEWVDDVTHDIYNNINNIKDDLKGNDKNTPVDNLAHVKVDNTANVNNVPDFNFDPNRSANTVADVKADISKPANNVTDINVGTNIFANNVTEKIDTNKPVSDIDTNKTVNVTDIKVDANESVNNSEECNEIMRNRSVKEDDMLIDDESVIAINIKTDINLKSDMNSDLIKSEIVPKKKISLFEDADGSDDDLFSDKQDQFSIKPNERKEKIGRIGKQSKHDEDLQKTPENVKSPPPGKLKHNLNINVAALMPGASIPRRRDTNFSPPSKETDETFDSSENAPFNDDSNQVETLYSVTKTRARIPIKRKPSSRRARQESMKKTASQEDDKNNNVEIHDAANRNIEEIKKPKNIFLDDDDDSDMFNDTPSAKPKASKSLFDEEDDEDDLFKPTKKEKSKKTEAFTKPKRGSLFDDLSDDDDGDIFSSKSKPVYNKSVAKHSNKPMKSKGQCLRRVEDSELLEDPLDALNK